MKYQLLSLEGSLEGVTPSFMEGAILASNLATKPLDPKEWLPGIVSDEVDKFLPIVTEQINRQHNLIQRSEYSVVETLSEDGFSDQFADFSAGFMSVWATVEEQWQTVTMADGTLRMLQALLTTLMLAIDEEQTQQQMKASGFQNPPSLNDLISEIDLMVSEVALAADEAMHGNKSQSVNPFKGVGRNESCPCESGKKFKQCCGKNS